ncbi:MAG: hypothetical protein HKN13_07840, partial [Rhodothermales bacterium]|nr:hypothetical protein [Rhodothermales bacterium]
GTTQRIDEFDKVFIELSSRQGTAQLGDFELDLRGSTLAQFSRKLQGVKLQGATRSLDTSSRFGGGAVLAAATTRGIFRSQTLEIEDGTQGPYRLEGASGERFIILIPASETVFLDGVRLVRGESNDYVVDYSTAEITFTANRLMSQEKRVVVEFQYTTNQFTRTLVATEVTSRFWTDSNGAERAQLNVAYIRESDSRQFFDEFGLTSADSLLIAGSGDQTAFRSGAEEVVYDAEAAYVQYTLEQRTLGGDESDSVFVAISAPVADSTRVFRVRFSRVGQNNGRYNRVGRNLNGIVYEYAGPNLGEYEPIRLLPIPKQQRLFDIGGKIELVPGIEVFGEFAQSTSDQNRLSSLDSEDDVGQGGLAGVKVMRRRVANIGSLQLLLDALVERRRRQDTFRTFNRTRSIEFSRDWNLDARSVSATGSVDGTGSELIDTAELGLMLSDVSQLTIKYGRLEVGDSFSSNRISGAINSLPSVDSTSVRYSYEVENVISKDGGLSIAGDWFRQKGFLSTTRFGGWFAPQVSFEHEERKQRRSGTDSLGAPSVGFFDIRPGVGVFGRRSSAFAEVQYRTEDEPIDGALVDASTSITTRSRFQIRSRGSFRTNATVGYRIRRYSEQVSSLLGRQDQESLVLSWNGNWKPLKRSITASWLYEAQTERTPRLQEIYVRTGPEFGDYVWIDDNGDGVLQIEEFVSETTANEGTYSRTFVPSDSLFSSVGVQARGRVDFDPSKLVVGRNSSLAKVLRNIVLGTVVDVSEKSRDPELANIYLLRQSRFRGENTLRGRLLIRQTLSLFRSNRFVGIDGSYTHSRGLSDLTASAEERQNEIATLETRVRLSGRLSAQALLERDRKFLFSSALVSRQFDLRSTTITPRLTWTPGRAASVRFGVEYARKSDRLVDRRATVVKLPLEIRIQKARKFQILSRIETATVDVEGEATGLASFELTDGRGSGRSYLWNVTGEYFVSRYLRASLTYDGRSPSSAPTLHTVRMQLSASF